MVLAGRKEGASSFLARIAIGSRPIFLAQGRVSLARTRALRLVISLADYFAVNIAVTLFRIVATCSAYLVLRFYKVISRAMKHFDKLCSLLLFIHSPRQAQNPSLTLVAIKWA